MPTPSRTSIEEIIREGRRIVESEGLDGLTMQKVARAVGVRAPSLYKHVSSRGELVRMVIESVLSDLAAILDQSVTGDDPQADLMALARAFRSFAHHHPESYRVLFAPLPEGWRPDQEAYMEASRAVLATTEAICGPDGALDGARLVTAWVHGFMTMELAGAFRIEGDLERAFDFGLARLGDALAP